MQRSISGRDNRPLLNEQLRVDRSVRAFRLWTLLGYRGMKKLGILSAPRRGSQSRLITGLFRRLRMGLTKFSDLQMPLQPKPRRRVRLLYGRWPKQLPKLPLSLLLLSINSNCTEASRRMLSRRNTSDFSSQGRGRYLGQLQRSLRHGRCGSVPHA